MPNKGGKEHGICHIVAVNMGYGHERPARVLSHLSVDDRVWIANDYEGIPDSDRRVHGGSMSIFLVLNVCPLLGKLFLV